MSDPLGAQGICKRICKPNGDPGLLFFLYICSYRCVGVGVGGSVVGAEQKFLSLLFLFSLGSCVKSKKINRSHTRTHRQRTTPPTPTHTQWECARG